MFLTFSCTKYRKTEKLRESLSDSRYPTFEPHPVEGKRPAAAAPQEGDAKRHIVAVCFSMDPVWILLMSSFFFVKICNTWMWMMPMMSEAGACKSSASRPASAVSEVFSPTTGLGQAECRKKRKQRTERAGLREIH